MAIYNFGAGNLWGTPLTDATGTAVSNPTPVMFGTLQDVSIDIAYDLKTLYGQNQFAVDAARGKGKITGKAKIGHISGALYNSLFFGGTMTSSIVGDVYDTTGAAIPATPYTITPTVPSSGTWSADLGVRSSTGVQMTRVASTPATGQYSVAAGVYTFAAADTALTVYIDYQYTATSTTAKTSIIQNTPMGNAPTFKADFYTKKNSKIIGLTLYSCVSNKLTMATKIDDFGITEFDFEAFADSTQNVLKWFASE